MAGRKDSRGRNLHTGESQRKDGSYMYRYTDRRSGKRLTVYAGDSHSTIKLIHALLYPALERAADDDIIRKNPAKNALSGKLWGNGRGEGRADAGTAGEAVCIYEGKRHIQCVRPQKAVYKNFRNPQTRINTGLARIIRKY